MGNNLITVKVKPKTHIDLVKVKAVMMLQDGKERSMNDIISYLLTLLPDAQVTIEGIKKRR